MKFKPHSEKQNRIIFSEKKITIAATGIQFGKTLSGVVWLKKYMHRYTSKDDNFIITTPTYKILKQATLPPFMKLNDGLGRLNKADMCFEMHAGGNVWIRSGQNPDSVVGITNVRAILCDEGGLYSRYFWDNIQARSSFSSCPVCIVTSPYSLNWLYTDFIRKIQQKDPYIMEMCEYVQAASYENPYFPKAEYDQRKLTMDSHRFSMIYGGNFGRMEGLVYKCFDDDVDVIDPIPLPPDTKFYGGIDWGYTDPMVITIRAVLPSGYQYQIAEYYKTQQTIRDVIEMAKSYNSIYKKVIFVCDPSRPEYIQELNANGIIAYAARNDIRLGIDYHYDLIANKKYKVFRNTSPQTIDEYSQYHYPEPKNLKPDQGQKDMLPVDIQNHCMDSNRYITMATYNFAGHKKKIIIKDHNVKEALPYLIDPEQEKLFKKRRLA
jgi:hypothetical protein